MPYRKQQFINNEIYHVILRGVADNLIFKDKDDYYRGIFSIYELNNAKAVTIRQSRERRKREKANIMKLPVELDGREKIVEVLAFCFMPNHIHLLLRQIKDNGITIFMRKIGAGYGGYFNRKYNKKGYVFQGRFRSIYINDDDQLKVVFTYIHTNPISLIEPNWKIVGIKDIQKVIDFLEEYKWSSYQDYINKNNFPSVTERDFVFNIIGGDRAIKDFINNWIIYKKGFKEPSSFLQE